MFLFTFEMVCQQFLIYKCSHCILKYKQVYLYHLINSSTKLSHGENNPNFWKLLVSLDSINCCTVSMLFLKTNEMNSLQYNYTGSNMTLKGQCKVDEDILTNSNAQ